MKKISKISVSKISRQWLVAKKTLKMVPSLLKIDDMSASELLSKLVGENSEKLLDELGTMKGSFIKAAQMLSQYGEYFLPADVNKVLKQIQAHGHYLDWEVIKKQIPPHFHDELEIEEIPLAAASIGQVHKAKIGDEELVLKIQYKGVDKAIDADLKILKLLIQSLRILPRELNLEPIYQEIKVNLLKEMDYINEANIQDQYRELLGTNPSYKVPQIKGDYSNETIICSTFEEGVLLSSDEVLTWPQQRKNKIAEKVFELFFKELFEFNLLQTDSHPGNYLVGKNDELILIDFGAVRSFDPEIIRAYQNMIRSFALENKDLFKESFNTLLNISEAKVNLELDKLWSYCLFVTEPIRQDVFDWSDKERAEKIFQMAKNTIDMSQIKTPPSKFLMLDRKVVGLFFLMKTLDAKFDARAITKKYL